MVQSTNQPTPQQNTALNSQTEMQSGQPLQQQGMPVPPVQQSQMPPGAQPTTQQQVQPIPKQPKKWAKWLIIGLVAFVIVGVVAYFIFF